MPQMAPISWLILFIVFSLSFIMFNILNYYCFNNFNKNKIKGMSTNSLNMNWKW